jgi:signal transduction histidine kinase
MFLRYISHEMRSPLSVAIANLQFMIEDSGSEIPAHFINRVKSTLTTCEAAVIVLNDVLSYESITAGKFYISKDFVPFALTFREACSNYEAMMHAKNIHFDFRNEIPNYDLAANILCAHLDIPKINQVVRNIMTNAVKFTQFGGNISVTLSYRQDSLSIQNHPILPSTKVYPMNVPSGHFVIQISDSGVGISSDNLQKIFGQFVQFDAKKLQGRLLLVLHLDCDL